ACEDHGSLRISDTVEDFTTIGIQPRRVASDRVFCGIVLRGIITAKSGGIDGRGLYVDRNVKPGRTGTSTLCDVPGALEVISDGEGIVDQHRILGDLLDHRDDVGFLVSEL